MRLTFSQCWYLNVKGEMDDAWNAMLTGSGSWEEIDQWLDQALGFFSEFGSVTAIANLSVLHAVDLYKMAENVIRTTEVILADPKVPKSVEIKADQVQRQARLVQKRIQDRSDWSDIKMILGKSPGLGKDGTISADTLLKMLEPSPIVERFDPRL